MTRRHSRRHQRKSVPKQKTPLAKRFWAGILCIIILLICLIYLVIQNTSEKYAVVVSGTDSVKVYSADTNNRQVMVLQIPGDTQLEVARDRGKIKIKNMYELSIKQEGSGVLLAESVRNNFYLPVYLWANGEYEQLFEGNLLEKVKVLFTSVNSNIGLIDRIRLGWFLLSVKSFELTNVDLSKYQALKKTTLMDGTEGYLVERGLPDSVLAKFTIQPDSVEEIRLIDNSSATVQKTINEVSRVIGARVGVIETGDQKGGFCTIRGKTLKAHELAHIFKCTHEKVDPSGVFTIEMELGRDFSI